MRAMLDENSVVHEVFFWFTYLSYLIQWRYEAFLFPCPFWNTLNARYLQRASASGLGYLPFKS